MRVRIYISECVCVCVCVPMCAWHLLYKSYGAYDFGEPKSSATVIRTHSSTNLNVQIRVDHDSNLTRTNVVYFV